MGASNHIEQTTGDDGRVELPPGVKLTDARLFNEDLAPTRIEQRTWNTYAFAALWISMAHCIPTYILASGLIKSGMTWLQAIVTILLGNTIVLVPILLNSHPGTKYGIPFPVFARAAYGVFGANVPAIMRALVACGWFGIQCWIGGHALHRFLEALWSGWPTALGSDRLGGYLPTEWLTYAAFWSLNILIVYRGMELLRRIENWAAPYVLVMTTLLLVWILHRASVMGGLGDSLSKPSKFQTTGAFLAVFIPSVTAMVGFWATLSLNMPDFTRYGRSQREQMIGQVAALPTTMTVFATMGVFITTASAVVFKEAIWDPIDLGARLDSHVLVAIAEFTAVIATLAMNIAANVVSPANDISNLAPSKISFRTGGLVTGIVATLMMPWKLLTNPDRYINGWLLGYSGGLGSIAGVLICDYWIIRKKKLALADLYSQTGEYTYGSSLGTNWAAILATAVGCFFAWVGLFVPALHWLYDAAWFSGTMTSGAAYWLLMRSRAKG